MATDPKGRYQSVGDFQSAIREYRAHIESIALASHATEELARAEKADDYQAFARAMFGFDEAYKQWDANSRAKAGRSEARVKYAASALRKGDYELGAGLLDPENADHKELRAKLVAAQREREARQQRLKTMKRVAGALVAMVFVVVSGALVWIKGERDVAQKERENAVTAQEVAEKERKKAVTAQGVAEQAQKATEIAKNDAVKA